MSDQFDENITIPKERFGTLYVVATPIGNLEDITLRALRILKEVAAIACEDTRHTRKLLSHYQIQAPTLSYYKGKEQQRTGRIIAKLLLGFDIALVSDAGTPGISDPGAILINEARKNAIPVVPIPGPSSLTTALSAAGLPETTFTFLGFLPARKAQRRALLTELAGHSNHLVFFEAPHRLAASLLDCLEILGDREVFWARELTKIHENLTADLLSEVVRKVTDARMRGESVVVIKKNTAKPEPAATVDEIDEILEWHCRNRHSLKDAVREVSASLSLSRTEVYKKALETWKRLA